MPEGIGLDGLSLLGPITLLKFKFSVAEYARSVVAEMWFYPDGYGSWSCPPSARPAKHSWPSPSSGRCWAGRGIDLSGKQQTKASTALRYFSRQPVRWTPRPEQRGSGRSAAQQRLCLAFALPARLNQAAIPSTLTRRHAVTETAKGLGLDFPTG